MLKDGFSAEDVAAAKQGWVQAQQLSRTEDRRLARNLNNYLLLGRTIAWDAEFERKVQALTSEQINRAMRKYITPDKITFIKAGDFAKSKAKTGQ